MSSPARPNTIQSVLTSLLLVSLSISIAPFSLLYIIVYGYLNPATKREPLNGKTVLVTGGRTTKSLILIRKFHQAGYRTILAEESKWGFLCATRFSSSIVKYYPLPDPAVDKAIYIVALQSLIRKEQIDLWVPGSSAGGTWDAEAGEIIRKMKLRNGNSPEVFIQSLAVANALHHKDLFAALVTELGMPTPQSKLINSVEAGMDFLFSSERVSSKFYILKCLGLDDLGRSDLTKLPLTASSTATSEEVTRLHLSNVPLPISKDCSYVLQEFLTGAEYCTHSHVKNGQLRSFLACPSNDLLMRYISCNDTARAGVNKIQAKEIKIIGEKAELWTLDFLKRWSANLEKKGRVGELTGHFSFDFIVDSVGTLFPIECNPRIHTAVTLLASLEGPEFANSYFDLTKIRTEEIRFPIHPLPDQAPISWIAHAFPLAFAGIVPTSFSSQIHPALAIESDPEDFLISPPVQNGFFSTLVSYAVGSEKDAVFDKNDLLPFWALAHVHWNWLLLRQVFINGRGWSRANVSTSRIFES